MNILGSLLIKKAARFKYSVLKQTLTLVLVATPWSASWGAGVEQLREFLTKTQSAQGEFAQRVSSARSGSTQNSTGSFLFQRPGKFRWIYAKPYEQVIVSDGEKLYLFDKDINQVTVKKLTGAISASPASILFGSNQFEKDFDVSESGRREGLDWIVAKPRTKDTPFERIEIGFRDALPQAMRLTDSFGQSTQLTFIKLERNPRLEVSQFRFTPPAGADVLSDGN